MIFFIVGVGRSGTSLLQSILTSHSMIAIPPETGFVRENILSKEKKESTDLEGYLNNNPKLKRIEKIFHGKKQKAYQTDIDFYRYFLKKYLSSQKKFIIGDKDPRLIEFIAATIKLFPDSKFIHLIRDPRDVLLSKKKAAWSKDKPSWYHIFANYVQLKMGELQGRQLSEDKFLSIRYEDLLNAPEDTVAKVCYFLNTDFEKSMLSFQDKARELVSEDEKQWKKETMGPLLKDNMGKWKGNLAPWEIALTEKLCNHAFDRERYAYSNTFIKLTKFQKVRVKFFEYLFRVLGSFYIVYRLLSQKIIVLWKF